MPNSFLYVVTVLIWGSTWLAIKYQLGVVAIEVSIAYRFALASLILLAFCLLTGKKLAFDLKAHIGMASLGAFLFSGNYVFMYWATGYITTGLVSVVFCAMVVINISLSRLFFKTEITRRGLLGATLGMAGICLVFWPEVETFDLSDQGFFGMMLAFIGTVSASFGNIVSAHNQKKGLPVIQANAWGMAYGTLFMTLAALGQGHEFTFDSRFEYLCSLLYLSVFGSVLGFGCYLTLLGNIGADKAVYSVILFPLVALSLSTYFEDYQWPLAAVVGVPLVLWGNILVLSKPDRMTLMWQKIASKRV
ncbi:DMT family transporter [Terasakiella sp. SH-1]|uniref:DMT family transporter n=1 Tax=Terasakiella sp. SH-1 TaxID=2560057 RepID=UPI001073692C|nr:DMT family transporter [Terasakiella sp. SH-1]